MARRERVVVVVGGNAFVAPGRPLTMDGQFRFAAEAMRALTPLLRRDMDLLLSHGNGPQVGHMLIRVEQSLGAAYSMPLSVCVAESEGELGYVLQQTLHNVLIEMNAPRSVAALVTQVVVDPRDPAFSRPEKPIGPFLDPTRVKELRTAGISLREEPDRGWRRVVPSPEPLEVVEAEVIDRLLDMGVLVVAAGGGGVPVVREGGALTGVDAVIDKDLVASLLAARLGATELVILTGVPAAYRFYGTERSEPLPKLTPADVRRLAAEGHFPPGSMGPKMEAAARFVEASGGRAIVCDPASLEAALRGTAGTIVTPARVEETS